MASSPRYRYPSYKRRSPTIYDIPPALPLRRDPIFWVLCNHIGYKRKITQGESGYREDSIRIIKSQ